MPVPVRKKECRFLVGSDEIRCAAHEYYNDPCCTCCYEAGREEMYVPEVPLVCPACGNLREHGNLICSSCQLQALWWLGWLGALKTKPQS